MTLLDHHRERLETTSAISAEVVAARGYRSIEAREELKGLGFPRDIAKFLPAIAIPVYAVRHLEPGESFDSTGIVLRPDTAYSFQDGRVAKYLAPANKPNVLDVHPLAREWLHDVVVPLVLTEGTIKADSAVSVGLCAIALNGVDGAWRNGAPLPAWELVPLKGRQVLIGFDSDVTTKRSVRGALHRLAGYLLRRGASVEIVVLPPGPHGEKTGLDDFLADHRGSQYPIGLLLEHAIAPGEVPDDDQEITPPLPADVTGADVLDRAADFLARFVHYSSDEEKWASALWTAHTHLVDHFDICAYLGIRSAVRESGKSRKLEILALLVRRGEYLLEPSDASVFRLLAEEPAPVLLIDELDQTLKSAEDRHSLVGLLNAGFVRGATVPRVEDTKDGRAVVRFPVYGPKCFASIGRVLPDTTASRTIFIDLKRRTRAEHVERWRARRSSVEAREVHDLLAGWAATIADDAADLELDDLDFLSDRQADIWEPLRIVAALAGDPWPERALAAAKALSGRARDNDGFGVELIRDVRTVFVEKSNPDVLKSGALVGELNALEDSPWSSLRDGRGLTTHRLARELLAFDLHPEARRDVAGEMVRGWWRSSLEPVWERYLEDDEDDAQEGARSRNSPSTPDQSVSTVSKADFRHEQRDSADSQTVSKAPVETVCETPGNGLTKPFETVETVRSTEKGEKAKRSGSATVVEEPLPSASDLTIAIGDGAPLEVHRLPPDASAEQCERLRQFLADAGRRLAVLAIDCETTSTDPYALDVRIWSVSDGIEAWAIDARDRRSTAELAIELARYPGALAAHNIGFDLPVAIRTLGLEVDPLTERALSGQLIDTMILARLTHPDARRIGLKEIAIAELGPGAAAAEEQLKLAFRRLPGLAETKWGTIDPAHPAYWQYAAADAALTARLHERLVAQVDAKSIVREMRIALICLRAGLRGWAVDPDAAQVLERDLTAERQRLEQDLRRVGIQTVTTAAGRASIVEALRREGRRLNGTSLARDVLEPLALAGSEVARDVLALRTVTKFLGLYVPMFLAAAERDGRLHAFPQTLATVTGRMSLPGVPLQTAPKGELALARENGTLTAAIRSALVADERQVTASVDFTTMELRIAAALSEDVRLRSVVEAGDAHAAVARRLFGTKTPTAKQRAAAKTVNFGVLYGMGGEGLARRLRIGEEQARAFVARWWDSFPAVRRLRQRLAHEERTSLWGRRLPHDKVPAHIALNHVIQGYGRDLFAQGLLALEDAGADDRLLLPLHDEYVLALDKSSAASDVKEIAALVRTKLGEIELPVETTLGERSWASVGGAAS